MAERKKIRRKRIATSAGESQSKAPRHGKHDPGDIDLDNDEIKEMLPSALSRAFVESKRHAANVRKSGLKPVDDYEGDMPELPDDIGNVDHDDLSNLLLQFQRAHATASWQSSMWFIESDIMEEIKDYQFDKALLGSNQSNEGKRKAEAGIDPLVVFFNAKHKIAHHNYLRYRSLATDLSGKVKAVSRVGGFKEDEEGASDARSRPNLGRKRIRS